MKSTNITKKILGLIFILIIAVSFSFSPVISSIRLAQAEGADVPTNQEFDFKAIMMKMKAFILDHLAEMVAKQILHQMTVSIVNWINSGFQGSPAFLTDPQGFFLDIADQETGRFLATSGALSKLCSPFSLDIRLALALDRTLTASKRYTCTLGKIVNNVQGTIDGFTGGDFSQGGWPAFISLTTEPQNNVYGSYLSAHSELLSLIGAKEGKVSQDLDRGRGFLSWEKCTGDGSEESYYAEQAAAGLEEGSEEAYYANAEVKKYQKCTTQTPGSVISGSLQKAVDSPIVQAELADDINAILNALVSQMINQMLTGGLAALSGGGGGGSNGGLSYTQQIIADIDAQTAANNQRTSTEIANTFNSGFTSLNGYKALYDQAVGMVSGSRSQYLAAHTCFEGKVNVRRDAFDKSAQSYMLEINNVVIGYVDPLLNKLTTKQASTSAALVNLQKLKDQYTASTTLAQGSQFDGVRGDLQLYEAGVMSSITAQTTSVGSNGEAQGDLTDAQAKSQKFNAHAGAYLQACSRYPSTTNIPALNLSN